MVSLPLRVSPSGPVTKPTVTSSLGVGLPAASGAHSVVGSLAGTSAALIDVTSGPRLCGSKTGASGAFLQPDRPIPEQTAPSQRSPQLQSVSGPTSPWQ